MKHMTPERFVWIWNTSKSKKEVIRRLGMKSASATARAGQYRKAYGVELQKFGDEGPVIDWAKVRRIAKEALESRRSK